MRSRRHLANWLQTFCEIYGNTEAPAKYVYWVGIGTIATALQRRVRFNQVTFQLYPHHYIILVGPPALKKSTAIKYGVDLLRQVPGINVGPSSVTWQSFVDDLVDLNKATPEEIAQTGIAIKDAAPILLPAGELGTLIDFGERASIDFFVSIWDSDDVIAKKTRMMGMQNINGPCVSIMAGTTPQWIRDNVKGSHRGGGMISRCIMPFEQRVRDLVTYPDENIVGNHDEQRSFLLHDLSCITTLYGEYKLTKEARELGKHWHNQIHKEDIAKGEQGDVDNWAGRRYSHVHKTAMSIAAAKRDELIINLDDLQEAITAITAIHQDFNKVFALSEERLQTAAQREVERLIQNKGQVLHADVYATLRAKFTKKEIGEALDLLKGAGIIRTDKATINVRGGGIAVADYFYWVKQ
jgi:hypothetical protein